TEFFFGWLDSIPRPKGFPREGPIKVPPSTPEELKAGLAVGGRQIGAPEEIVRVIEMYEALGVDQLIYAPLTLTLDQRYVLGSISPSPRRAPSARSPRRSRWARSRCASRAPPSSPRPPPTSPCPPAATRMAWSPASRSAWLPASRPSTSR